MPRIFNMLAAGALVLSFASAVQAQNDQQDDYLIKVARFRVDACTADNFMAMVEFDILTTVGELAAKYRDATPGENRLQAMETRLRDYLKQNLPEAFAGAVSSYNTAEIQFDETIQTALTAEVLRLLDQQTGHFMQSEGARFLPFLRGAGLRSSPGCYDQPALYLCTPDVTKPIGPGTYMDNCVRLEDRKPAP